MDVRDRTKTQTEYKGHVIRAGAGGRDCPCLPCFNVHDCGGYRGHDKWKSIWDCATRFNNGCPSQLRRPFHFFHATKKFLGRKPGDSFKCLRCGQRLIIQGEGDTFDFGTE